ncbi:MAG TPA: NADH-quinone oxidoreductase subunit L [Methylophaga sp.]|nr:NADH-quinone oxidoreductase subunit L [Methylophaga sp.]
MSQFFSTGFSMLIPLILVAGALVTGNARLTEISRRRVLRVISVALGVSTIVVAIAYLDTPQHSSQNLIALNGIHLTVLFLVSFMAIVLIRFSERYLYGEERAYLFWRWLLLSLASVSIVVLSNHLMLLWLGWVAISLCFHRLLLFYPDRPRAVLAAHKKFILARLAELCLLVAVLLLYFHHGSFQLNVILDHYLGFQRGDVLSFNEKLAAFLIAQTALIKCAQLPLHGWLIQVVEAPTPISALLHAGIINLGGFLLISFAPLMVLVPVAQWTLIVVAGLSTVISALVMLTRISAKVRLAWSTCAQMGLMLIECALGLYELALLHLLTHSLYKAYAFLSTGETVQEHSLKQLAQHKTITLGRALTSIFLAMAATAGIVLFTSYEGPMSIWLLVNTALALYLISGVSNGSLLSAFKALLIATVLVSFYIAGKFIIGNLLPDLPMIGMFSGMDLWLIILFFFLFALTLQIWLFPDAKQTQILYRWLFSGLYLDELMTRLTLQLWPVELRPKPHQSRAKQITIEESWV